MSFNFIGVDFERNSRASLSNTQNTLLVYKHAAFLDVVAKRFIHIFSYRLCRGSLSVAPVHTFKRLHPVCEHIVLIHAIFGIKRLAGLSVCLALFKTKEHLASHHFRMSDEV